MYQTVFISVVGVVLVFKLCFLVAAVLFTLKNKDHHKHGSRRGSDVSAATTTEVIEDQDDVTDHREGIFGELGVASFDDPNFGTGEKTDKDFEEQNVESIIVNIEIFEDDFAGIFDGHSVSVGKHNGGLFIDNNAAFEEQRVTNSVEGIDGDCSENRRAIGKSIQFNDSKPNVSFFDALMHTDLSNNSIGFCKDSAV